MLILLAACGFGACYEVMSLFVVDLFSGMSRFNIGKGSTGAPCPYNPQEMQ